MNNLSKLAPQAIWHWFEEITQIPRSSKKEGRIVAWLEDFARTHGLQCRTDAIGNVVILKAASAGMESRPTVVLQNHVDMVCEKNADAVNASGEPFDFERDAIQTYVADGWMRARGTTLGADNGLGMAAVLALLLDTQAVHGPLEALFTVDEETGLSGAFGLGEGMITGKYLINLDSEDEGEVFIGCAGGVDTQAFFDYTTEPAPTGHKFFELSVSGLRGGHSGDDIEKGRGNSNKILSRALWAGIGVPTAKKDAGFDLKISTIDGGNLRNAIPREARAVVAIPEARVAGFVEFVEKFAATVASELQYTDPEVRVAIKDAVPAQVIDPQMVSKLVSALVGVPNGVQAMSFAMPGLVETSSNLASIKMDAISPTERRPSEPQAQVKASGEGGNLASIKMDGGQIVVTTSQRSSVESAKRATAAAIEAVLALAGGRVEHSEGYPGWAPNPDSPLLEITKKAYNQLFSTPVKVRAIHAGLECGLFLEKYPGLDMVSFGPTILGAHSPDERLEIASVDKFWQLLLRVLSLL